MKASRVVEREKNGEMGQSSGMSRPCEARLSIKGHCGWAVAKCAGTTPQQQTQAGSTTQMRPALRAPSACLRMRLQLRRLHRGGAA